jgi:hypothetical protein
MKLGAFIMSCAERADTCRATLANLAATDWRSSVEIILDSSDSERKQTRQECNALVSLRAFLQSSADVMLFLEDDLQFNVAIETNIRAWAPVRSYYAGQLFASLYNPNVRPLSVDEADRFFIADPDAVYGSQAFVLSREMADYIAQHYWEVEGLQDIKMSRLASRLGPVYYHKPSLVQHVGYLSSWGGHYHKAEDYDSTWRA